MDEQAKQREEREINRMVQDLTDEALERKLSACFRRVADPQRQVNRLINLQLARMGIRR